MTRVTKSQACAFLALVCLPNGSCRGAQGQDRIEEDPPVLVQTEEVTASDAIVRIGATGTVEARNDVTVVAETAGKVEKVLFELGDAVEEDQKLVKLDRKLQALAISQAKAQLEQARAADDLASLQLQRMEKLAADGGASQAELDAASMEAKSAAAAHKMAKVALGQAQEAYKKTGITSPIAGTVTLKMVSRGEMLAAGSPVAQVTDRTSMKVVVGLTEREIVDIEEGQVVTVTSAVDSAIRAAGSIAAIGYKAVGPTRTFPVEIWIDDPPDRLHPGMTVDVDIQVTTVPDAIVIHVNDVYGEQGEQWVWVVRDGLAVRRAVEVGQALDEKIIVTTGLSAGERIVVKGGDILQDGTMVEEMEHAGGPEKQPAPDA